MLIPRKAKSLVPVALFLLLALVAFSYSATRTTETGVLRKLVIEAASPVARTLSATCDGLRETWKRYLFLVGLAEENRRLIQENDFLAGELNRYREGYLEGERLRALLDLKKDFPQEVITARVIDNRHASLFKTLLIDKGTRAGLRVGLPVLATRGVAGKIMETSWNASRVLLMYDENSSIDALIQRTRVQGILQGTGAGGCTLKYVSRTEDVIEGDVVITGGIAEGGKGLCLGVVTGVFRGEGGLFQRIDVAPAVDFSKLEEVLIPLPRSVAAEQVKE
ncbi:MAG: rod shape-determining protein MreC [Syntrophaceae bacterium]|nr:rod shape-determining protein MreC [Syntrophaceae bacterium]